MDTHAHSAFACEFIAVLGQVVPPLTPAAAPAAVAGDCLTIGSGLLTDCQAEQRISDSVYPLSSTVAATQQQIDAGVAALKAQNLPSAACCSTAKSFKQANCIADPTLMTILPTVGVTPIAAESLLDTLVKSCP